MKRILLFTLLMIGFTFATAQPASKPKNSKLVRVEKSVINWWGYKVVKSEATTHTGSVKLKMGKLYFAKNRDKELLGGEFLIDMRSLVNTDLKGEENVELTEDLKSANFFEVRKFPMAKFEMKKVLPLKSDVYNTEIIGDITIKGIRKTISFPANVIKDDYSITIQSAKFPLNRQDFNVFYKSSLKDYLIKDQMDIQFMITTKE